MAYVTICSRSIDSVHLICLYLYRCSRLYHGRWALNISYDWVQTIQQENFKQTVLQTYSTPNQPHQHRSLLHRILCSLNPLPNHISTNNKNHRKMPSIPHWVVVIPVELVMMRPLLERCLSLPLHRYRRQRRQWMWVELR